ncbi:SPFH domain-containing protein [Umezakia ovalisporum]|jgi:regulator of protease activity HflC (stomatin/prohibitin superfamily)|uniref:SPFH/Band 7/PHB domain protein n=2 Tax=Umezakia ovalisporum TaxID=75695 RepID=A0AA43GZH9_9CYAN|nr:SPFH domain-containing protein [Umezakia ovalisporum]MBI1241116.1 paraslipin [Nostoc sp. RI_552]MDH6056519.1 SPFH/Band 7/PHB domain protein [Umezakia ovalisporum FSS-43]MDH6064037.1 SPFH/Band 7/PHB domain protein [Umezakia ovalisporum FSS-62]MDH6065759.1 SPFH/Band 7/PHB domain protein [Umezakia ovalisporum APH033B]MDH6069269.1 SPFH/Band 7/PHB domain protein [Umezakia ovalisporum CobakiLakeA]
MEPIIAIVLALIGYALGSAKLVNQGNEALVERLGRYHRTLSPGLNFIVPLVDQIVMEDTTREKFLDIKPQNVITRDNIYLEIDAVLFWRIKDMVKSFYEIDDLEGSLSQLATTTLREIIAQNTVEETNISRAEMDTAILNQLNQTTADWGVEILRLDIQSITPPESVRKSMEEQRAAEIKKRALISEAEGEREAAIKRAQGTQTSMQIISEALRSHPESKEILRYLVAQDYVVASQKLGESNNAKIVFVDPSKTNEVYDQLIADSIVQENSGRKSQNGGA